MNATKIDVLIAVREQLTNRRDERVDWKAVRLIDAQLAIIPPGQDNRVDLLLGRRNAALPERAGYFVNPAVTLASSETQALIDKTRQLWCDVQPIEY